MGYIATHPYARDLRDKKRQILPKLKLTDKGLVDVEKFALVDLFTE